jgi:hypothetical protein
VLNQPSARRTPQPTYLEQYLLRRRVGIDKIRRLAVITRIGNEPKLETAAKYFGLANTLSIGNDSAFMQDGVNIGATHAAESQFTAFEGARGLAST